jgi:FkbM family methyltransferase
MNKEYIVNLLQKVRKDYTEFRQRYQNNLNKKNIIYPIQLSILKYAILLFFLFKNILFSLDERLWMFIFCCRNLLLKNALLRISWNGINFKLQPYGAVAVKLWKENKYKEGVLKFLLSYIKPGYVFFDIGANIGIYSIIIGLREKTAKIYAFETSEQIFQILKKNLEINFLDNVQSYNLALWNCDGLNTTGNHIYSLNNMINRKKVKTTTLSNFVKINKIFKIDIINLNINGAELFVFDGAKEVLEKENAPLIVYESNSFLTKKFNYHPVENIWLLRKLGYDHFWSLNDKTGEFSYLTNSNLRYDNATIVASKSNIF